MKSGAVCAFCTLLNLLLLLTACVTELRGYRALLNYKGYSLVSLFRRHLLNGNAFVHFKDLPAEGELKSSGV